MIYIAPISRIESEALTDYNVKVSIAQGIASL